MFCPRNHYGQPACYITCHPDYPQEKFCVTCRQRFYQNSPVYIPGSTGNSSGIFVLIVVLLMAFILLRAIPRSQNQNSPRQNELEQLVDFVLY